MEEKNILRSAFFIAASNNIGGPPGSSLGWCSPGVMLVFYSGTANALVVRLGKLLRSLARDVSLNIVNVMCSLILHSLQKCPDSFSVSPLCENRCHFLDPASHSLQHINQNDNHLATHVHRNLWYVLMVHIHCRAPHGCSLGNSREGPAWPPPSVIWGVVA